MLRAIGILSALLWAAPVLADCAPAKLVRMVTQNASPGVPRDSFAAQPKSQYRLGNGRMRLQEKPDPESGVHLLFITDAPKAWRIDLASKTGQFIVDDSDPPLLVAPVFPDETLPEEVRWLEFGCENLFIARPDVTHTSLQIKGKPVVKHSLRSGEWTVSLSTSTDTGKPFGAVLSHSGKVVGAVGYLVYETLDTVPEGLFAPPDGIKIEPAL